MPAQVAAVCRIGEAMAHQKIAVADQIAFVLERLLVVPFEGLVRRHGENQVLVRDASLWLDVWTICLCSHEIVHAVSLERLRTQTKWRVEKAFKGPSSGAKKVSASRGRRGAR